MPLHLQWPRLGPPVSRRGHVNAPVFRRAFVAFTLLAQAVLGGFACTSATRLPAPEVSNGTPAIDRGDARPSDAAADGPTRDVAIDVPITPPLDVAACTEPVCCVGPDCPKRATGALCQRDDQCDTGFCADGVCCTVACRGACVSCNQPDRMGECLPAAAGDPDPHLLCRRDPPESCGESGVCNGQGGCARHAPGTLCGDSACTASNTMMPGGECDGEGTCVAGQPVDCTPFLCAGRSCRGSCSESSQCASPHVCVGSSCGKRGNGQNCGNNDECQSGFCTDGVCCESACAGRCSTCASTRARGRCVLVPAGTNDPRASSGNVAPGTICVDQGAQTCGTNGRCDGKGGCELYKDGTICAAGRCDAGKNTAAGVSLCRTGRCEPPTPRTCAPFAGCDGSRCSTRCDDDKDCAPGNVCTEGSCGKRPLGSLCSRDDECAGAGVCAQGRCCDQRCDKPCMACNLEGSHGACTPVPAGGADPSGACRTDACTSGCDGRGNCRREKEGTTCGPTRCDGEVTLVTRTCSKDGACQEKQSGCSGDQTCKDNRCVAPTKRMPGEGCVADGDCASGACVGNRCCTSSCSSGCRICTAATAWKCTDRADESPCGVNQVCRGGRCGSKCTGTRTLCGDDCVDLQTDAKNCGGCGRPCEGEAGVTIAACASGKCTKAPAPGASVDAGKPMTMPGDAGVKPPAVDDGRDAGVKRD